MREKRDRLGPRPRVENAAAAILMARTTAEATGRSEEPAIAAKPDLVAIITAAQSASADWMHLLAGAQIGDPAKVITRNESDGPAIRRNGSLRHDRVRLIDESDPLRVNSRDVPYSNSAISRSRQNVAIGAPRCMNDLRQATRTSWMPKCESEPSSAKVPHASARTIA